MDELNISQERSLSYPKGFKVSALNCGIKFQDLKDLALLYSNEPCKCIGLVTANKFKAHPVIVSTEHLKDNMAKAVIVNSGNANCLNGNAGYKLAVNITQSVAKKLNINPEDIVIASTGRIGEKFPADKILENVSQLVDDLDNCKAGDIGFTEAITTTDTKIKMANTSVNIDGSEVRIAGVAKGAGMIKPDLATMLAFFTTDVNINVNLLNDVFKFCVDETFNNINVDAQTSTNDMAVIFSNGLAKNKLIDKESFELDVFKNGLLAICKKLSYDIVNDAEGATKVIKILVKNVLTKQDAKDIANLVADSNLVKTFIYGKTLNWGRIVQTIGKSKSEIVPEKVEIKVNGNSVFKNETILSENIDDSILKGKEVFIDIDIGLGEEKVEVVSCDLTPEYIKINSKY